MCCPKPQLSQGEGNPTGTRASMEYCEGGSNPPLPGSGFLFQNFGRPSLNPCHMEGSRYLGSTMPAPESGGRGKQGRRRVMLMHPTPFPFSPLRSIDVSAQKEGNAMGAALHLSEAGTRGAEKSTFVGLWGRGPGHQSVGLILDGLPQQAARE
jgi:hypothetical protein